MIMLMMMMRKVFTYHHNHRHALRTQFTLLHKLIIVLIFHSVSNHFFKEAIVFKLTNAVCESYNKSAIVIPICRLKAIKRNRAILNVSTNIIHPVSDIRLHLQVLKKANGYKPWLLKTDLDLCQYMRHSNNPMAKIFFDMIQEFTNLNHSCPYVAIKRNRAVLNVSTILPHPVNDIRLHMQVLKKANGYKPWLLKTELDFCQYMRHSYNPMAKLLFDLIQEFTNLNHSCPYVSYYVFRFQLAIIY
ncbi:uncharacterized protein Dwil_GK28133 [Drosophila willistoni]|uniref:Uncharacterized protein n=1 Tax=Drosophila willistoni TaxID=7260 RepID=A0A0Q9X315_DROWI|nr:uncharacterized protein Dwil_GK28133 [Drosophila willistoni]